MATIISMSPSAPGELWFERLLADWRAGRVSARLLPAAERHQLGDTQPRPEAERVEFTSWVRDAAAERDQQPAAPAPEGYLPKHGEPAVQFPAVPAGMAEIAAIWHEESAKLPPGLPGRAIRVIQAVGERLQAEYGAALPTQVLPGYVE